MTYKYLESVDAIAQKDIVQGKAILVQKGRHFQVDVYQKFVHDRGNPLGITSKVYFLNSTKKDATMGMLPIMIGKGRPVELNKDFVIFGGLEKEPVINRPKKQMIPRYVLLFLGAIAVGYVASRVIK